MGSGNASGNREKRRLDQLLVEKGLVESREKARRVLLAGGVRVDGQPAGKPGTMVPLDCTLTVPEPPRYVGRGGLKLEAALDAFGIQPAGLRCLDVGASTGGFTDCLLQRGAAEVVAVDVGHNQIHWKLRADPRVEVREGVNARLLQPGDLGPPFALSVADVSFISLTLILPAVFALLQPEAPMIALVKPQFELAREDVGRGGIVRSPELHARAVDKIRSFVESGDSARFEGVIDSPIEGAAGNREFLVHLVKNGEPSPA